MATDHNTSTNVSNARPALTVAEHYPMLAPVVEREFKRICPTLQLLNFNAWCHQDKCESWILFSGTEADLLRSGVIDSSMIAIAPKRVFKSDRRGRAYTKTTRLAGDRVEVRLDLNENLDRAHPLAPLASWNWEALVEKTENPSAGPRKTARAPSLLNTRCQPELEAARIQALVALGNLTEIADSFPMVATEIMRRAQSLEELLRREIQRLATQVKPPRPAYLQLIVSNEARPT